MMYISCTPSVSSDHVENAPEHSPLSATLVLRPPLTWGLVLFLECPLLCATPLPPHHWAHCVSHLMAQTMTRWTVEHCHLDSIRPRSDQIYSKPSHVSSCSLLEANGQSFGNRMGLSLGGWWARGKPIDLGFQDLDQRETYWRRAIETLSMLPTHSMDCTFVPGYL